MLTKEVLLDVVCECSGISMEQMFSKNRKREIVMARYVYFFLARKFMDIPLTTLGRYFGMDHATIIHGVNTTKDMLSIEYQPYLDLLARCDKEIRDKHQKEIKLSVFAPFNADLDLLIVTLIKDFKCRVIKQKS